jgi:hypothetical protein
MAAEAGASKRALLCVSLFLSAASFGISEGLGSAAGGQGARHARLAHRHDDAFGCAVDGTILKKKKTAPHARCGGWGS